MKFSLVLINSQPGVGPCDEEGCCELPNLCNRNQPANFAHTLWFVRKGKRPWMCNCLLRLFSFTKAIKSSIPLVLQKAASSLVACRCINLIQKNKTISLYGKYFRIDAAINIYNLTKCFLLKAERRVTARWASCHRTWLWDIATGPCTIFVSVLFNSSTELYATKISTTLIESADHYRYETGSLFLTLSQLISGKGNLLA